MKGFGLGTMPYADTDHTVRMFVVSDSQPFREE